MRHDALPIQREQATPQARALIPRTVGIARTDISIWNSAVISPIRTKRLVNISYSLSMRSANWCVRRAPLLMFRLDYRLSMTSVLILVQCSRRKAIAEKTEEKMIPFRKVRVQLVFHPFVALRPANLNSVSGDSDAICPLLCLAKYNSGVRRTYRHSIPTPTEYKRTPRSTGKWRCRFDPATSPP